MDLLIMKKGKVKWNTIMKRKIDHRYLMATKALHKLGDISNDIPDICEITEEDDNNYYGMWVFGIGFFDVQFPKSTTRKLTKAEFERWSQVKVHLSGMTYPLNEISLKLGTDFDT